MVALLKGFNRQGLEFDMKLFARILVPLIFFYGAIFSAFAVEVGNSFNTATELLVWNEVISVKRAEGQDGYLKFHLNQGEGVAVSLKANIDAGSQFIQFYQPDVINTSFISTPRSYGAVITSSFTAAVTGTYWLKLTGTAGTSDIGVFKAFYNPDVTDADRPFFSSFNTARYFAAGEYVLTDLPYFFRFEVRAGDDVAISLTAKIASGSQRLAIFQPSNLSSDMLITSLLRNNNTGTVSFTAQTTGVYYARVSGAAGHFELSGQGIRPDLDDDGDGLSNTVELARGTRIDLADTNGNGLSDLESARLGLLGVLEKEFSRADLSDARTLPFAMAIPYFDKAFSAEHDGDDRFFAFNLREGEGVTIKLNAIVNRSSQRFSVIQPDDNERYFTISHAANASAPATISFIAAVGGTYYVRLMGAAGRAEIAVYNAFFNPGVNDHQRQFLSSFNTAGYLIPGQYDLGELDRYHRFEARAGDEVTLSLTGGGNVGVQRMHIFGPESASALRNSASVLRNQTTTESFVAKITGVYYVKVAGAIGTYFLEASGIRPDADDDQDGLSNTAELARGTRIDLVDTNHSGLSDLQEALAGRLGINPAQYSQADLRQASSFAFAKPIPYQDKPFSIAFDSNDRYFTFDVTAGESYTLTLAPRVARGKQSLSVYAANNQARPLLSPNGVSNGDTLSASFTATVSGKYWLKISGSLGSADVAVYNAFSNPGTVDAQRDFYGSPNTAQLLVSGEYTKQLSLDSFFRFHAVAGEEVSLSFSPSINLASMRLAVFEPENLTSALFSSNPIHNNQTTNHTFTATTSGFYFVRVSGVGGLFDLQVAGITPVIAGSVSVVNAEGLNRDDFIFRLRLASPLKEGQFVGLSLNDNINNEFLPMNCVGTICTLTKGLTLPSSAVFYAGVYDEDNQLIGDITSQSQCLLPACIFALNVEGYGMVSLADNMIPALGKPLRFEVSPNQGFKVSRNVGGSCKKGTWLTSTLYEISEFDSACMASFNFTAIKAKKGLPMWLLMLEH